MKKSIATAILCCLSFMTAVSSESGEKSNILKNNRFEFHAFMPHRNGLPGSSSSGNAAFWNTENWGDITVTRESHVHGAVRPAFSTGNMVQIGPGKKIWQFFTLPEAGLAHGDKLNLTVYGYQTKANCLQALVKIMKLDSEDGNWSPKEFGLPDKRTFPKHARGELIAHKIYKVKSDKTGKIELRIKDIEIEGHYAGHTRNKSSSKDINTIGVMVEFKNLCDDPREQVWIASPSLTLEGPRNLNPPENRKMIPYYRFIPRTIQKLWKGEALHIIMMGSSIDRGSANPRLYIYDENPDSKTFKQALCDNLDFRPELIKRPDLDGYVGRWQHYFSAAGRMRLELMRKYNLPVSKICLNFMAKDGSCVGEAHSGLKQYCTLSMRPNGELNGHKTAPESKWRELYPELFSRSGGPGPDLVIFGSGANEKTDTPDEVAVFEGTIRWIQKRYPNCEFLFCMWQNRGERTPNTVDLQALALRYQIPFIDTGKKIDDVSRFCNSFALVPDNCHPAAAGHYLWFKEMEKAFECWDPVMPGQKQLHLPERVSPYTYGWEGDMIFFDEKSPRIKKNKFIFEDMAVNCWGWGKKGSPIYVDGKMVGKLRKPLPRINPRNSMYRYGRTSLGDRHIIELTPEKVGKKQEAQFTGVDAKICPNRSFFPVDSGSWDLSGAQTTEFKSEWGAPYGNKQVILQPGKKFTIKVVASDLSVAYVDTEKGGSLKVSVDGKERLNIKANIPYVDIEKKKYLMENRKGIRDLGFGVHTVEIEAGGTAVPILGLYTYDSRPNRDNERRITGMAAPGENIEFVPEFKAIPVLICHGGLKVSKLTRKKLVFGGNGKGYYQIIGE